MNWVEGIKEVSSKEVLGCRFQTFPIGMVASPEWKVQRNLIAKHRRNYDNLDTSIGTSGNSQTSEGAKVFKELYFLRHHKVKLLFDKHPRQ